MRRANWTSLGIIVTLLVCMVHRLASSKRDTIYASAASCRHMMVLPWKHISVFPTSWAISRTSRENGSFWIRSSVLFWYHRISQRATVPGRYLLGLLTFPAFRNSFCGALPPMVGRSFLWAGSSPEADGLASAAIWTNCWVGNNDSDRPASTSLFASSTRPNTPSITCATSLVGEELLAGEGWCTGEGGCFSFTSSFLAHLASHLPCLLSLPVSSSCPARRAHSSLILSTVLPSLSFLGIVLVLAILFEKWKEKGGSKREITIRRFHLQTEKKTESLHEDYIIIWKSRSHEILLRWPFWIFKWSDVTFSCQNSTCFPTVICKGKKEK